MKLVGKKIHEIILWHLQGERGEIILVNFTLIFIRKEVINPFLKITQGEGGSDGVSDGSLFKTLVLETIKSTYSYIRIINLFFN